MTTPLCARIWAHPAKSSAAAMVAVVIAARFIKMNLRWDASLAPGTAALREGAGTSICGRHGPTQAQARPLSQFEDPRRPMLSFLFRGLTGEGASGAALFGALTAEARRQHWYVEGRVADTLDGRF